MNQIQINYPNGTAESYTAPSSWDELTPRELKIWASICLHPISLIDAKKILAQFFYRISAKTKKHLKTMQLLQIGDTLDFLFDKNNLTKWIIPRFRHRFRRYYGPEDAFANLTIAEYRRTELYYQSYVHTQDNEWLIKLTATLYRPKRKGTITDDIREELTEHGVFKRSKRFKKLKPYLLQACLYNYEGCRNHLIEKFASAFKKSESSEQSKKLFDLEEVIEALAGDKFGSFNETEKTNLHRFFRYVVTTIEKMEEQNAS